MKFWMRNNILVGLVVIILIRIDKISKQRYDAY